MMWCMGFVSNLSNFFRQLSQDEDDKKYATLNPNFRIY